MPAESGITKSMFPAMKLMFGIDRDLKVNDPDISTLCKNTPNLIKSF